VLFLIINTELETTIRCPGVNYLSELRLSLVGLNNMATELPDDSERFVVRISMINKCKKLGLDNQCDLTNQNCIFRELPPIDREDFEEEDFNDKSYF